MQRLLILIVTIFSFFTQTCRPKHDSDLEGIDYASLSKSAKVMAYVKSINNNIKEYLNAKNDSDKYRIQMKIWDQVVSIGKMAPDILEKVVEGVMSAKTRANPATIKLVCDTILVQIENQNRFLSWDKIVSKDFSSNIGSFVNFSDQSSIDSFAKELEKVANTKFLELEPASNLKLNGLPANTSGENKFLSLFIDGEKSWKIRHDLMSNAKKSVWIFSWAFYTDKTGKETVDKLVELKKTKNIDVKVIVDGPVSTGDAHKPITQELISRGIEVIRWSNPKFKGFGMHRKVMILDHDTDNAIAIFGGKNFGDYYSHLQPPLSPKATPDQIKADTLARWRDTDMAVTGAPVQQIARTFAAVWNNYCEEIAPKTCSSIKTVPTPPKAVSSTEKFAFVDQDPTAYVSNTSFVDPVYYSTIKMIDSAKSDVLISNAYFILTQPLENALFNAMKRGVKVKIHINSESSMDEVDKPLLGPIYRNLERMLKHNLENIPAPYSPVVVYLQKDRTLHSKYIVVDGMMGWVGSYNIHPRSSRYESETVGMFLGKKAGAEIVEMFNSDTSEQKARATTSPKDVERPKSQLLEVIETIVFEQL